MIHLMSVPASLLADVASGAAYVTGALVKDAATNQILAHLQPTRLLSQALSLGAGGPLAGLQQLSGFVQNVQLLEIKKTLETVQTIASIGATASVLNLGVSIGGFAMVLSALKGVQHRLDTVDATVQRTERKLDLAFFSQLNTWLRRAEETFELPASQRLGHWEDTECRLDEQVDQLVARLALSGVRLDSNTPLEGEALQLLGSAEVMGQMALLFALAGARAEALLCLDRPKLAGQQFKRTSEWLSVLPTDTKALTIARLAGRVAATDQVSQVAQQAKALTTWVSAGRSAAEDRAVLCQALHDRGVDSLAYVLKVRNHPMEELLLLNHGPAA